MKKSGLSLLLAVPLALAMTVGADATVGTTASPLACSGRFQGVWELPEGRSMTVTFSPQTSSTNGAVQIELSGGGSVTKLEGRCAPDADETHGALISFKGLDRGGSAHAGELYLTAEGRLSGAIDGYAFRTP